MKTGSLIKELRMKKGLTQEELAYKTELSTRTIQRIENGDVDPRAYTLQMIAKALDVDFSIFVEDESEESQEIRKLDDNNWLGLLHLSGIVPLIFPTVLIWNLKKDKTKVMADHYRAVITFQLMIFGVILGGIWVYFKIGMLTPLLGVLLLNALFTIFRTMNALNGKPSKPTNLFDKRKKETGTTSIE
jgi:transcriptional regulator with XRE-family HTH domain